MAPDWIQLDGTANTRDVGGLPVGGGRRTVSRRLLRSDSLQQLSPADVRRLVDDYGVRTVADLRAGIELTATGPGPMTREPLVTVENLSLFPEEDDYERPMTERRPPVSRGYSGLYLGFLLQRPDSVLSALRLIAHGPGTVMVNCTAGKDRTGTVIALALAEAGVERAAIVADYTASAERYDEVLSRHAPMAGDRDQSAALKGIPRASTMERFLDGVTETAGGVGPWLAGHGWTEDDRTALKRKLLEDEAD